MKTSIIRFLQDDVPLRGVAARSTLGTCIGMTGLIIRDDGESLIAFVEMDGRPYVGRVLRTTVEVVGDAELRDDIVAGRLKMFEENTALDLKTTFGVIRGF